MFQLHQSTQWSPQHTMIFSIVTHTIWSKHHVDTDTLYLIRSSPSCSGSYYPSRLRSIITSSIKYSMMCHTMVIVHVLLQVLSQYTTTMAHCHIPQVWVGLNVQYYSLSSVIDSPACSLTVSRMKTWKCEWIKGCLSHPLCCLNPRCSWRESGSSLLHDSLPDYKYQRPTGALLQSQYEPNTNFLATHEIKR